METLNDKETRIYKYIADTIRSKGYSPSVRDIQHAMGYKSTSTVHMYLERLEDKGYIRKENGKSRTLRLEDDTEVTNGASSVLDGMNFEGFIGLPDLISERGKEGLFALKVKGNAMIGAGISDGDIVIAEKCDIAEDGDIVIALVNGETTVMRFSGYGESACLQPENPDMKPISAKDAKILGKVRANVKIF